jgi:hypothetical protein
MNEGGTGIRVIQTALWENEDVESPGMLDSVVSLNQTAMKPAFSTERGAVYKGDCMAMFASIRDVLKQGERSFQFGP